MSQFDHICDLEEELSALNWRAIDPCALILRAMVADDPTQWQSLNPETRRAFHAMWALHIIEPMTPEQYYKAQAEALAEVDD